MATTKNKLQLVLDRLSDDNKDPITNIDLSNCNLDSFPRELFVLEDSLEFLNLGKIFNKENNICNM